MARKILVVEDNEKNRLLITDILKYHGYEVLEAEDGQKGLKLASESKPDLILLDMQMPVMDGIAFIKEIKKDPKLNNLKIITVTSFAMKGDREKILALGVDDYISKPINTRELPKIIGKHVGAAK